MIYIVAIRLSAGGTTVQHITDVRYEDTNTRQRKDVSRAKMVEMIDGGTSVWVRDTRGDVRVNVVRANPPYLRTAPDDRSMDNLLALPRF